MEASKLVLFSYWNVQVCVASLMKSIRIAGRARGKAGSQLQPKNEFAVKAGEMALMYADLGVLSLVIKHLKSGLTSRQIPVFGRDKKSPDASIEGGGLREMELDVDFGDGAHYGKMNVRQDDDGVLEASLLCRVFS